MFRTSNYLGIQRLERAGTFEYRCISYALFSSRRTQVNALERYRFRLISMGLRLYSELRRRL